MTAAPHPLPATRDLSDNQYRGLACVWCGNPLTDATAIDLEPQPFRELDRVLRHWYPRACPGC